MYLGLLANLISIPVFVRSAARPPMLPVIPHRSLWNFGSSWLVSGFVILLRGGRESRSGSVVVRPSISTLHARSARWGRFGRRSWPRGN